MADKTERLTYDEVDLPDNTDFPGCCGITSLLTIPPKIKKTHLLRYIKETNENINFGGLATAISKGGKQKEATLAAAGFKVLFETNGEKFWIRKIRYRTYS